MGVAVSKFKQRSVLEIVAMLDKNIKSIEENRLHVEQRHRKVVTQFVMYSTGLYISAAAAVCMHLFPVSVYDQIFYVTPLLLFPMFVLLSKRLLTWYFLRKLARDQNRLRDMRGKKERLLAGTNRFEPYRIAQQVRERLRRMDRGGAPHYAPATWNSHVDPKQSTSDIAAEATPPLKTRRHLLRDTTYVDRLLQCLVGDGPHNRYALICRQCESHNGMVLKDQFEFVSFRCCYCYCWNPARKRRPPAPKLPTRALTAPKAPRLDEEESDPDDIPDDAVRLDEAARDEPRIFDSQKLHATITK